MNTNTSSLAGYIEWVVFVFQMRLYDQYSPRVVSKCLKDYYFFDQLDGGEPFDTHEWFQENFRATKVFLNGFV